MLSLCANIGLVALKVGAGVLSNSISLLAEGVQSTVDVAASAAILLTIRAAERPPDEDHPWGHGKFENLASLAQIILILGTTGYLLNAAWQRWLRPAPVEVDWGIGALVVSVVVNYLVSRRVLRVGKQTGSPALIAEAAHLRGDMLACFGVLGGLVAVAVTGESRLDPVVAAVMTIVVVVGAVKLLRDAVRPLLDESLPPHEAKLVHDVLAGDPRVLGYHRLRSRQAGSVRLLDLHLLLDDDLSLREAHSIAEDVEAALRAALPNLDVILHPEPYAEEMAHQVERHGVRPISLTPNPPGENH